MKKKIIFYSMFWGAIVLSVVCGKFIFYLYKEQMIAYWPMVILEIVQLVFFGYFVFRKEPDDSKDTKVKKTRKQQV